MTLVRLFGFLIACLVCLPACQTGGSNSGPSSVTGTVTYRERIALPPNSTIEVRLLDVTEAGKPATVIAEQVIDGPGSVPVKFSLRFNPARIDPDHRYNVSARIINGGMLLWMSDASNPVITQGHPTTANVLVVRATP